MTRAEVAAPLTSGGVRYPYFFLDLDIYPPIQVAGYVLLCMAAFTAVGYVFFFIDKLPSVIFRTTAQNRDIDV